VVSRRGRDRRSRLLGVASSLFLFEPIDLPHDRKGRFEIPAAEDCAALSTLINRVRASVANAVEYQRANTPQIIGLSRSISGKFSIIRDERMQLNQMVASISNLD
jgi:hypothetical protein